MKIKKLLVLAILLFFGVVLIIKPERYLTACFNGICLWAECVLPSLFPFSVITLALIKLGAPQIAGKPFGAISRKLKLPAASFPLFLMSVCSGYPAGSRIVSEYRESGLIDDFDVKKLAPLCSTCGPLFALGTVGVKAFGDSVAGIKLMCACLLSVVPTSLVYCLFSKSQPDNKKLPNLFANGGNALYDCFYGGVTACLTAGGFICFFYTLSVALSDFSLLKPLELLLSPLFGQDLATGLCKGLCEATGGCFSLASSGGFFALPLAGFLVTFGGVSILLQQLCYLSKHNVKSGFFVAFKLVQGIVCFALLCLFSLW